MGSEYIHMALNLVAVIGLMLLLAFVMKKLKLPKQIGNQRIKIINTVPIGAKEKIILLEVNNTILLLGATPNHVETLYVFDSLEAVSQFSPSTEVAESCNL